MTEKGLTIMTAVRRNIAAEEQALRDASNFLQLRLDYRRRVEAESMDCPKFVLDDPNLTRIWLLMMKELKEKGEVA